MVSHKGALVRAIFVIRPVKVGWLVRESTFNELPSNISTMLKHGIMQTICPGSSDPFYIVTYYILNGSRLLGHVA